jgi:hypothetical protein
LSALVVEADMKIEVGLFVLVGWKTGTNHGKTYALFSRTNPFTTHQDKARILVFFTTLATLLYILSLLVSDRKRELEFTALK